MVLQKLNDSEFEQSEVFTLEHNGNLYPFRARADILSNNSEMYDLKTTSSLNGWQYSADKFGYDLQCFLYCYAFDIAPENMGFIVIDKGSLEKKMQKYSCGPSKHLFLMTSLIKFNEVMTNIKISI